MGGIPVLEERTSVGQAPLLNFRCLLRQQDALGRLAAERRTSRSALMRAALDQFLERELREEQTAG